MKKLTLLLTLGLMLTPFIYSQNGTSVAMGGGLTIINNGANDSEDEDSNNGADEESDQEKNKDCTLDEAEKNCKEKAPWYDYVGEHRRECERERLNHQAENTNDEFKAKHCTNQNEVNSGSGTNNRSKVGVQKNSGSYNCTSSDKINWGKRPRFK